MENNKIKTIIIKSKSKIKSKKENKKCSNINLENHVEIKNNCLKYFFGSWVKAINIKTKEYNSGGFVTKLTHDIIYLRSLQHQELIELEINKHIFYTKKGSEQYIGMQEIELEKEKNNIENKRLRQNSKLLHERELLFQEKKELFDNDVIKFEKIKNKFFKLFYCGKVKILM